MNGALRTLRSAGILLAIWGIAAGIGWLAGVLPPDGRRSAGPANGSTGSATEPGDSATASDAAVPADGAVAETEAGPPPPPQEPGESVPPAPELRRAWAITVCGENDAPVVAILQVVGDAKPELVVGCGGRFDVFGMSGGAPLRVATLTSPPAPLGEVRPGTPTAGDVDGDSRPDLLLPFVHHQSSGANASGSLHLVRQSAIGAFAAPLSLGNLAAEVVSVAQLDGQRGFDVVALNRANTLARRPSEAWVFTGGPAPTRAGLHASGVGASDLAIADLDRDGELDLTVAVEEEARLDLFFGDGTGSFPRTAPIAAEGARELAVGDLDGDGGTDVLVTGSRVQLLRAGPAESLAVRPLELPADLSQPRLYDVDGDGKRDIVGLAGGRLRFWAQSGDLSFEERSLLDAEEFIPTAYAIGDLDGDGRLDAAAVDSREAPILAVVSHVLAGAVRIEAPEPPKDAPLVLRIALE